MKKIKLIVGGVICASYLLTSVLSMASDNINSNTIHFDKGSNGTIIKSTVTGDESRPDDAYRYEQPVAASLF